MWPRRKPKNRRLEREHVLGVRLRSSHVRAARNRLSDPSEADDAERRAGALDAEPPRRLVHSPSAGPDRGGCLGNAPRRREQEGKRQVSGRLGEHARRRADRDSARTRGFEIDVVAADGVVRDGPQLRRGIEQIAVDPVAQHAQQAVGLRQRGPQIRRPRWRSALPDDDVMSSAQLIERCAANCPRDKDSCHAWILPCSAAAVHLLLQLAPP